jgi:UTP-glucose-1-phosphate uridylyltransferase
MEYNDELACSLNGGARVNGVKSATASITPKFTLIPNPATNIVALKNINSSMVKEVFITDALGRILQNHRIEASFNEKQFDVSNLNGGTYFFKLVLEDDSLENLKLLIVK